MKLILIAVALSMACIAADDTYTDKYDNLDIDEILGNRRLLNAYTKCVLDLWKCTPEGKELKSHISEALQNGCAKCTSSQRHGMKKVIKHFINNDENTWDQLVEKYDPKRLYTNKYEKELKSLKY